MALSFEIREMRPDDYRGLVELWEQAMLTYHPEGRDSKERITKELGTPMALFLVAEANGRLIGSLLGTTDGRKGWINRLAVHPEWQRKGVALALLKEMEKRFDQRGVLVLCALIHDDNPSSRAFFTNAGYEEDPTVVYYSKRKGHKV
ncbi:MAG: GNAT family N-acetyltransferase [Methanomassiliicoccales archaeon]|jgi:ribosomal protein S18 acetylase RimI-like enzyme|nr:GNAT family N-acetyltransferase [Methanomassiliicoccales archaeon]MDD1755891.1 GNAT family N-acetyltransferase [Methanomassiliicoccales archaeon]